MNLFFVSNNLQESIEVSIRLENDFECLTANTSVQSSQESNIHLTTSPRVKRKRLEPSTLSEQEQIALAIGNSLREVNSAEDKSDSCGDNDDDDDDDSDFDNYDDESSNQSFVKSHTFKNIIEKSRSSENFSILESEINKNGIATETTENSIDSYENYLGDKSGLFSIPKIISLIYD